MKKWLNKGQEDEKSERGCQKQNALQKQVVQYTANERTNKAKSAACCSPCNSIRCTAEAGAEETEQQKGRQMVGNFTAAKHENH